MRQRITGLIDDRDQMRSMLESMLSFLRSGRRLETMTLADVASTLQLITDQFGNMGRKVAHDGPAHAMETGSRMDWWFGCDCRFASRASAPRPRSSRQAASASGSASS
jgi:hypothetical protein